ncbi:MAG: HupE/UreJ family protein [Meiothermus sp.]|nr:HupE/UreJ family protein [Meiothermus sp.]
MAWSRACISARLVFAATILAQLGLAHTNQGETSGLVHGWMHPLGGLDHLLAMVAVGLWAAQLASAGDRRALWGVPLAFVGVMALGGLLGMLGLELPLVETGILLSVFLLGGLVLFAARLPLGLSAVVVGVFALFHGHAHGAEMPPSASGLEYALGFVLATTMLHLIGIGVGLLLGRASALPALQKLPLLRLLGALVVLGGVMVMQS